jgi:hypothetical protein
MMLVPAMAFAWWVVSMSSAVPPGGAAPGSVVARSRAPAPESAESAPVAESDAEDQRQDSEDQGAPEEPADPEASAATGDTGGQRVPVKLVTPSIVRVARTFLDLPMGAERRVDVDGRRYVFVLERHYHPPGFVGGPVGYHKGVTVYEFRNGASAQRQ